MKLVIMRNDEGVPYPSYSVMYDLFALSGLPSIDQSEIDLQSNETYVLPIVNGNSLAWARSERSCKFYCWQIERWLTTADEFAPTGFDQLWVADRYQANALIERGFDYVRYMPIGGHPGLGIEPTEKHWDFATICYTYGRRQALLGEIACNGYSIAPNAFGEGRKKIISACRAGLSIHQHNNDPSLNPLRATLFSCGKLPMVFEYVRDPYPFDAYGLNQLEEALADKRGYVESNYRMMTETLPFRKVVEAACA